MMDDELICPKCTHLLDKPINLPCSHNVCYECAKQCTFERKANSQRTKKKQRESPTKKKSESECNSDDSGYLSVLELQSCLHQQLKGPTLILKCPKCSVNFILDERGVDCLPRNLIIEGIVDKNKLESKQVDCELCEVSPPVKATVMCEQCCCAYCDACLQVCHPKRGPLASHSLIHPHVGVRFESKIKEVLKCTEHEEENISMFCALCRMPVCYVCIEGGRHRGHESKALGTMCKEQKAEMIRSLTSLDTRNKELSDFVDQLTEHVEKLQENTVDFEARVVAKIDDAIARMEAKKSELIATIGTTVAGKIKQLNHQKDFCVSKLDATKSLIKYTDEVVKESNAAAFLQVSSSLNGRLNLTLENWIGNKGLRPVVTSDVDIHLPVNALLSSINDCKLAEGMGNDKIENQRGKPGSPVFDIEKCYVENNALTLEWHMRPDKCGIKTVDYIIEVDDGMRGAFQAVHRTTENSCWLGGLQFQSTYRARVIACNKAGEGPPSEVICLTTPDVAVFKLDIESSHPDILFSNECRTVSSSSFENRVTLGNVGFSRGVHYWEVSIDRYEGNPDPAIGVAMESCTKDTILGKDSKAWAVYVDSTRSWFQHNNAHIFRSEGGVQSGSVIGLLLDLDNCLLTFYRNEKKYGPVEFPTLQEVDVVYPAFSLTRNITMTLYSGLPPPDY